MKNFILPLALILATPLFSLAQLPPDWVRNINALPDSAQLYPVRTMHDNHNNIYVLSTWDKQSSPGRTKIHLRKYNSSGTEAWTYIYGDSTPRAFDMAVDEDGFAYIAGEHKEAPFQRPLLLKVSPAGTLVWMRDSASTFSRGRFEQVIFSHNLLYLRGPGLAIFTTNGTEKWANTQSAERICVDHRGRLIASAWDTASNTLFRYDTTGVRDLADSSIAARRIAVDQHNSIYLLVDLPEYTLVKHDSSGNIVWHTTDFPVYMSFGDIGFEVLVDHDNNVVVTGIYDTIFKFTPQGSLIWRKSMDGLDAYMSSAQIVYGNFIAIGGTYLAANNEYMMKMALFNLQGKVSRIGSYNGNSGLQEFTVGMTVDNSGIYLVENNNQNGTLVKFPTSFFTTPDFSMICIDSVWYDSIDPHVIHTRVFNGGINHLNYPSVQIISPTGDTIGNPLNKVDFFAHLGNGYQVYTDSITTTGITNWSGYTFLMNDGFGDTSAIVPMCGPTGLNGRTERGQEIRVWPNPFSDLITLSSRDAGTQAVFSLFDLNGRLLKSHTVVLPQVVDCRDLAPGMYFYTIADVNGHLASGKLIAE